MSRGGGRRAKIPLELTNRRDAVSARAPISRWLQGMEWKQVKSSQAGDTSCRKQGINPTPASFLGLSSDISSPQTAASLCTKRNHSEPLLHPLNLGKPPFAVILCALPAPPLLVAPCPYIRRGFCHPRDSGEPQQYLPKALR